MGTSAKWPCRPLKEIATKIGSGATPLGGKNTYKTEGVALIRSLNVYDFQFSDTDLAYIDEHQAAQLDHVTVQPNDILLNITGASVARCCIVNPKYLPARVNQHVAIVRISPDLADPLFVLYSINSPHLKRRLLALAQGGATREALTKATIEEFEIPLPPLPVQRRIAGVLGAYDELIEVNQRRIRILEQMARALYREWFVHFRFPGHEHVPRVASPLGPIPKGWEVVPLGAVVDFAKGRKPTVTRKRPLPGDVPVLLIENLRGGEAEFTSPAKMVLADIRDTLMVMDGASSCDVAMGFSGAVGSTLGRFRTTDPERLSPHALYRFLEMKAEEFKSKNIGAAIPHANRDYILGQGVAIPPKAVALSFHERVEPIQAAIETFKGQIHTLRRTRDLLLPRLISGQVELASASANGA